MLRTETFNIPLGFGVDQSADKRALELPALALLRDAEVEKHGGLQPRKPCDSLGVAVLGGGTIAYGDIRRIVPCGAELLLFTKDKVYSWSAADEAWVSKGTHLAVKVEETARFVTTGDQFDSDRAELDGYVIVTWHELRSGNSYGYVAAYSSTTGAVTMAPREVAGLQRMRLVALDTKILLSFYDGVTGFYVYALDPANPAAALAGASTTIVASAGTYYDVCKVPGQDLAFYACRRSGGGSYEMVTFTSALTKTNASKSAAVAFTIAVSAAPNGTHVQIVRCSSVTTIHGDYIAISGLATVNNNTAIATTTVTSLRITCAHRSVQDGGAYRCYVFYNDDLPGEFVGSFTLGEHIYSNWIDTSGAIGTSGKFVGLADINSRAFDHEGSVYLWLGFSFNSSFSTEAGSEQFSVALQNTYFLYRDDAFLCAKAVTSRAGGLPTDGWLPNVQALGNGAYACAGLAKRVIEIGGGGKRRRNYAARSPHEMIVTFDSNEARRSVRLGETLYVAGGEGALQYDGVQLTEVGFHIYPWALWVTPGSTGPLDGIYAWKQTPRWNNARGEVDRGTTASTFLFSVPSAQNAYVEGYDLTHTHKTNRPIALETWRTIVNPPLEAEFYLVTSKDPGQITGDNPYIPNDVTAADVRGFEEGIDDDDLVANEASPENGATLENLAPPPATIIAASDDRVFLAGVAGDPDRVWYSKRRNAGEVAAFNDGLAFSVPRAGGAITGLVVRDGLVYVFRETALYLIPGDGFDNTSGGVNYGPARELSLDVGATSQEAIAITPTGIVFQSRKGKYRVNGTQLQYIGAAVKDHDGEEVLAVHVVESQHQIRWVTSSRVLVLDYAATSQQNPVGQWSEWTLANGLHACMWNGSWVFLSSSTGALVQQDDYGDLVSYGIDLETPWIKMNDLQGAGRVRRILITGEHLGGDYKLRVRIARDYDETYFDDKPWPRADVDIDDEYDDGETFTAKIGPSIQRCKAIKLRITVGTYTAGVWTAANTEAVKLTGIGLEVGIKPNLTRRVPVESKA